MKTVNLKSPASRLEFGVQDSFAIRWAGMEDAAGIQHCLAAAFEKYCALYTPGAFADTVPDLPGIERRLREMRLWVAISNGEAIGTLGAELRGEEGHLRGMAVAPAWHGRGVSAALLEAAEAELRRQGCRYATLDTTQPLHRARRFYRNHGYTVSGRRADYFGMELIEFKKWL